MMKTGWKLFFVLLVGLTYCGVGNVHAEEFYRGKTLRLVVGYSPGGGYDTYARLIARYLAKYIPGEPRMIVENRPGAGGLISANHVYHGRRQDGTTILHVGGSTIIRQFTGSKNVKYDVTQFKYIGAPTTQIGVLVVTQRPGVTDIQQVLGKNGKEIVLGGIATGSPTDVTPILLRDVLGAKVRLVSGYRGTANIRLAMEQGELDGMVNAWSSLKNTNWKQIESGEWPILLQISEKPIPDLPKQVPMLSDLAQNDEQRQLIRLTTTVPYQFARPLVFGPKVPAERLETLRSAFQKTMADENFLREAKKARISIDPVDGQELRKFVVEFIGMPEGPRGKVLELLK